MTVPASILDSVHAVETPFPKRCESPLCTVEFQPSGLQMEPKRYCSTQCRQQASLIRRAAKLLQVLPIARQMGVLMDLQKLA